MERIQPGPNNIKIFTYGTLKTGEALWPILQPRIGRKAILKGYELHDAGFPAMCKSGNPESEVIGEVFDVDTLTLQRIDFAEGYRGPGMKNLYNRETVEIENEGNCFCYTAEAWARGHKLIEGGEW